MADRAGLGFLGFIFGGVTAAVMLVAATVVISHAGGAALDEPPAPVAATLTASD
jgi:hypothetical protein